MKIPPEVNLNAGMAIQANKLDDWDTTREKCMDAVDGISLTIKTLQGLQGALRDYAGSTECEHIHSADYCMTAVMASTHRLHVIVLDAMRLHPLHHDHSSERHSLEEVWKQALPMIAHLDEVVDAEEQRALELLGMAQLKQIMLGAF